MSLPQISLVKTESRWVASNGEPITLSAEWEVKGLEGLQILKMRPPEMKRFPRDVPVPAWKVRFRPAHEHCEPDALVTEITAALLDKRFKTRRDAMEAVSVELWRLSQ